LADQLLSGNPIGNAVIGQAGGPTAVINQSLIGLIKALRGRQEVQRIYGMKHGVSGLVRDEIIELDKLHDAQLSVIAATPSAALGSTRDKPDEAYCRRIFDACERHNIRYFFYIGGNDTSDTVRIVSEMAETAGYTLRCIHIPKTIDNDLPQSDHTPGYPSAAKFVIQAFMGDNLDNRAIPGIKINIVMGRDAGWLTGAAALARQFDGDGPHLICLPEVPFDPENFAQAVQDVYAKEGRCLVAVSEGIRTANGIPVLQAAAEEQLEKDQHGNIQLSGTGALGDFLASIVRDCIPIARVRTDTFGYMQRSFCGVFSTVDAKEARECGQAAAHFAISQSKPGSLALRRVKHQPYETKIVLIDLEQVAAQTRQLDPEFIGDHYDITEEFIKYLRPLIGKLPVIRRLV